MAFCHSLHKLRDGLRYCMEKLTECCLQPNVKKMEARRNLRGLGRASCYMRSELVRARAVRALGRIADPRGTTFLVRALRDENHDVRMLAVGAIGRIRPTAADALAGALQAPPPKDIAKALAGAGAGVNGIEALRAVLEQKEWERMISCDDPSRIRKRAARALVCALASGDYRVRETAADALQDWEPRLGGVIACAYCRRKLRLPDDLVRPIHLNILVDRIGPPPDVPSHFVCKRCDAAIKRLSDPDRCPHCRGRGELGISSHSRRTCSVCGGTRWRPRMRVCDNWLIGDHSEDELPEAPSIIFEDWI